MFKEIRRYTLGVIALLLIIVGMGACSLRRGASKPAITILWPPHGAQLLVGQEIAIESLALDNAGVVRVELWVDGALVRVDAAEQPEGSTALEMSQSWTPVEAGRHTITVKAVNRKGVFSEPSTVLVEVIAPAESIVAIEPSPTPTSTGSPLPSPAVLPSPSPAAACMNNALFVADVTVPDETKFKPGEAFEKVWRMRNTGSCAWGAGYLWTYESGELLGAPMAVAVPPTAPGADADLRVAMTAPAEAGRYVGRWRMQGPDGRLFGQRATVIIVVLPAGLEKPAAPANLSAKLTESGAVVLTWMDMSDNEEGVYVYREDDQSLLTLVDVPNVTEVTLDNLPCDTDMGFFVKAYNKAGESPPSNTARLRTPACHPKLPTIRYFRAEPATIDRGQVAVLSWDLENAREARLFPGGEGGVVAPGSMEVSPAETTTYRLVATNEFGIVERKVTVYVRGAPSAAGPTVMIQIAPTVVGESELFRVTVSAHDDSGLHTIWWWGVSTGDAELDSTHAFECQGQTDCTSSWEAHTKTSGTLNFLANARSLAGRQAEQNGPLPAASIRVISILYATTGLSLGQGQCVDVEAGTVGACEVAGMDLHWLRDDANSWWLVGEGGGRLASLGIQSGPEAVSYEEAATTSHFEERLDAGEGEPSRLPPNTLLAVRTNEGRLCKAFVRASGETLILDIVTYLE